MSPAGCDSNQNVVVTVQDVPAGSTALGVYYGLDSRPGMDGAAGVTQRVDQFALKLPGDYTGTLTTSVFAYRDKLPCIAGSGSGALQLSGQFRQDLTVSLAPEPPQSCIITKVPVSLPPTAMVPLASWGDAPDNIWIVGEKGVILRWDGQVFRRIPLPPELAASPPTWRAVAGVGRDYVWIAGNKGAVARWNGSQLTAVGLVNAVNAPFDLSSPQLPDWVGVSVANSTTDDVFFAGNNNLIGHYYKTGLSGVAAFPLTTSYRAYPLTFPPPMYPVNGQITFNDVRCIASNECWFVGLDPSFGGYILQAYSVNNDGSYIFTNYSMSDTQPTLALTQYRLLGVWTNFAVDKRELFVVGIQGTLLYSNNSSLTGTTNQTIYPIFQRPCGGAVCTPAAPTVNLHAIGGTSLSDLWIAGDGGVLLRWDASAVAPTNPLVTMATPGLTANLRRVFSTGGRVFVSGEQQTFASPIP